MQSLWQHALMGNVNPQLIQQGAFGPVPPEFQTSGITSDLQSGINTPGQLKTPISLSAGRLVGPPIMGQPMQQPQQRSLFSPMNGYGSHGVR